jgi:hypothetical protein
MCWVGLSSLRFEFVKEWFESESAGQREAGGAGTVGRSYKIFSVEWPYQDNYIVGALHVICESGGDLATFVPDPYGVFPWIYLNEYEAEVQLRLGPPNQLAERLADEDSCGRSSGTIPSKMKLP